MPDAPTVSNSSQLNQPVTGTMAVLLSAKDQGILSNERDVIDALVAASFRVSDALAPEVLRQAGQ